MNINLKVMLVSQEGRIVTTMFLSDLCVKIKAVVLFCYYV